MVIGSPCFDPPFCPSNRRCFFRIPSRLPDKHRGNTLNCSSSRIYSAVQVCCAKLLHDHASNNLPNLRACLNTGTEHTSTQVVAELLEHLIAPSAFVYSRLFNNSSVANGSTLLFHFHILLLFKKRRKGKMPCSVELPCLCMILAFTE